MLCPQCHAQYPPEVTQCPADGARCLLSVGDALRQGPTSVSQAVKIALAALEAVDEQDRTKTTHGPVGPDAVCFMYDEGIVRVMLAPESRRPIPPVYVAPEARPGSDRATAAGRTAEALYGIGVMVHHALKGRLPPVGQPLSRLAQDDLQDVPEALDDVLAAMTAERPGDRPSLAQTREALEALELDSTIVGNRLMRAVREASVVPRRQIVLGPDVSNAEAGYAETLIRDNHEFGAPPGQPEAAREREMGAETTLLRTHSSVDLAQRRGTDGPGAMRWWLVVGALILGAALGFAAVRWTSGL